MAGVSIQYMTCFIEHVSCLDPTFRVNCSILLVFQEHSSECFLYAIIDVQFHNRNISVENRLKDPLKPIRDWLYTNLLYWNSSSERQGPILGNRLSAIYRVHRYMACITCILLVILSKEQNP